MKRLVFVLAVALCSLAFAACSGSKKAQNKPEASSAVPPPLASLQQSASPQSSPTQRAESRHLAPGTIQVRVLDVLDSGSPPAGLIRASIVEDVKGADSRLAIPAGTPALLSPLLSGKFGKYGDVSQIGLSLFLVDLDGHQYMLKGEDVSPATALVTVDSTRNPVNKTAHIGEGTILEFTLRKPADLVQLHG